MALAPVELPPDGGCGAGAVEFALGSAFSSCSLCSAADDDAAEELEPFPAAVVVVWGTYCNFPSMSRVIFIASLTFRIQSF